MPVSRLPLSAFYKAEAFLSALYTKAFEYEFQTKSCHLHYSCRFFGRQHISINHRFRARRGLWIEAVSSYFGQTFTPYLTIGHDCSISENSHIACCSKMSFGNFILIGSGVLITDHNHGNYSADPCFASAPHGPPMLRNLFVKPVIIGDNVFIGDGVRVLPGAVIEDGAVIAANSVVSSRVPRNTIYAGAPARYLKSYDPNASAWTSRLG
jgi:lipopolysaccharide O-acetyltransferase